MAQGRPGLDGLVLRSLRRTSELFSSTVSAPSNVEPSASACKLTLKIQDQYGHVKDLAPPSSAASSARRATPMDDSFTPPHPKRAKLVDAMEVDASQVAPGAPPSAALQGALQRIGTPQPRGGAAATTAHVAAGIRETQALVLRQTANPLGLPSQPVRPEWHAPWKLMRVIAGHGGWVRCASVDVSNEWFVTGSADRTLKVWDLASGQLKLTLPGHVASVRAVVVSPRHPYLFSASEDKEIKCWDLEYNRVIRNYHGHLSAVYSLSLHPTMDILVSGGRDSSVRVWDMRTKKQIHLMAGHTDTVHVVETQDAEPQVISGSADSHVRLWDLAAGRCRATLTNHKKGVRALAIHKEEYSFVSGSADNLKKWKLPDGAFMENLGGHRAIINSLCLNRENVLVSAADNGTMHMWDYRSGYRFQEIGTIVQPGSLTSEAGIFATTFDQTGSRLITCEADKTIKIWKEDESATPETHPIDWKPNRNKAKF